MVIWVQAQTQFLDYAKEQFAQVADGWLVAYAKRTGGTVVTLEEFDPNVRRRVPIPNVCRAFDVDFVTTFEMLRSLLKHSADLAATSPGRSACRSRDLNLRAKPT